MYSKIFNKQIIGVTQVFNRFMLIVDFYCDGYGVAYECDLEVYLSLLYAEGRYINYTIYHYPNGRDIVFNYEFVDRASSDAPNCKQQLRVV